MEKINLNLPSRFLEEIISKNQDYISTLITYIHDNDTVFELEDDRHDIKKIITLYEMALYTIEKRINDLYEP